MALYIKTRHKKLGRPRWVFDDYLQRKIFTRKLQTFFVRSRVEESYKLKENQWFDFDQDSTHVGFCLGVVPNEKRPTFREYDHPTQGVLVATPYGWTNEVEPMEMQPDEVASSVGSS